MDTLQLVKQEYSEAGDEEQEEINTTAIATDSVPAKVDEDDGLSEMKRKGEDQSVLDQPARKKARVVWTDELHASFVKAVDRLGAEKAVPKKIMEIMNEPGITRENVASHLQKWRQNHKKIHGEDAPKKKQPKQQQHQQQQQQNCEPNVTGKGVIQTPLPVVPSSILQEKETEVYNLDALLEDAGQHPNFHGHIPYDLYQARHYPPVVDLENPQRLQQQPLQLLKRPMLFEQHPNPGGHSIHYQNPNLNPSDIPYQHSAYVDSCNTSLNPIVIPQRSLLHEENPNHGHPNHYQIEQQLAYVDSSNTSPSSTVTPQHGSHSLIEDLLPKIELDYSGMTPYSEEQESFVDPVALIVAHGGNGQVGELPIQKDSINQIIYTQDDDEAREFLEDLIIDP